MKTQPAQGAARVGFAGVAWLLPGRRLVGPSGPARVAAVSAGPALAVVAVVAVVALGACLQTVDLRGSLPPPVACMEGERIDPSNGACKPCQVDAPPDLGACPCGYGSRSAPYPYCEGDAVAHDCVPCTGGIDSCLVYHAATRLATSCELLATCCAELAKEGWSCCPLGSDLVCTNTDNLGQYEVRCVEPTCCTGAPCPKGDADCASWQSCDVVAGRCVPACRPPLTQCCADCGCLCEDLPNPP